MGDQEIVYVPNAYRSSKWHYRQRTNIFELILHLVADTETDDNYLGITFSLQIQTQLFFAASRGGGRIADQNCFGHNFDSEVAFDTLRLSHHPLPTATTSPGTDTRFFWSSSWCPFLMTLKIGVL